MAVLAEGGRDEWGFKKSLSISRPQPGCHKTKLSLAGNNLLIPFHEEFG
jgi:hypothetical protein